MSSAVKTERISPSNSTSALQGTDDEIQEKILRLCGENPNGVSDDVIQKELGVDGNQRAFAINNLVRSRQIAILRQRDTLLYKLKDGLVAGLKDADNQERVVYEVIESAGNKGIWTRDIRFQTNLLLPQVNKVLKSLETKKLVKSVKSVAAAKKKVYMLYNLEPDRTVTGGSWYSDQDFESEFVQVLHQQCLRFLKERIIVASDTYPDDPIALKNMSFATSQDVWKFINDLNISKVPLSVEDIEMILQTLIYDGTLEKSVMVVTSGQVNIYRSLEPLVPVSPVMHTPCGICPVSNSCHPGGAISPKTCIYLNDWLDF